MKKKKSSLEKTYLKGLCSGEPGRNGDDKAFNWNIGGVGPLILV